MKKVSSLRLAFLLLFTKGFTLFAQGDYFQLYVINASKFDIICEGMPEKGEGIFTKYTSTLKAGQKFLFGIEKSKGILPKGVEGDIVFRLGIPKLTGFAKLHFNHPQVGNSELIISDNSINWPFTIERLDPQSNIDVLHNTYDAYVIRISVDTTGFGSQNPASLNTSGISSNSLQSIPDEPVPAVINFDWQVTQRMPKDDDDEKNGKAYEMVTYYFTTNGDYAAIKPEDGSFSLMVYSKQGHTWTIYDKKKTIIVMNMPKTVAEGGMAGKKVAEDISKKPLQKDPENEGETLDVIKTGKTKNILGYTSDEYIMKTKQKNGPTASFWYAKVPFDPVKIYTMGVGRPEDLSKIQNNPKTKNSIMAIPVLNMNYLWVETEAGGKKGQETLEIKHVNNTIFTSGYKVKVTHNLKEALQAELEN